MPSTHSSFQTNNWICRFPYAVDEMAKRWCWKEDGDGLLGMMERQLPVCKTATSRTTRIMTRSINSRETIHWNSLRQLLLLLSWLTLLLIYCLKLNWIWFFHEKLCQLHFYYSRYIILHAKYVPSWKSSCLQNTRTYQDPEQNHCRNNWENRWRIRTFFHCLFFIFYFFSLCASQ